MLSTTGGPCKAIIIIIIIIFIFIFTHQSIARLFSGLIAPGIVRGTTALVLTGGSRATGAGDACTAGGGDGAIGASELLGAKASGVPDGIGASSKLMATEYSVCQCPISARMASDTSSRRTQKRKQIATSAEVRIILLSQETRIEAIKRCCC